MNIERIWPAAVLVLVAGACADHTDPSPPLTDARTVNGNVAAAGATAPSPQVALTPSSASPQPSAAGVSGAAAAPMRVAPAAPAAGSGVPVQQLGAACGALVRCCVALTDRAQQRACDAVVDTSQEPACQAVTVTYCGGMMSVPSSALPPAATPPITPPSPGAAPAVTPAPSAPAPVDDCAALDACCATLTDEDDQEDCEEAGEDAKPSDCRAGLMDFCPAMVPPPAPGMTAPTMACMMLDTCCAKLRDDDDQEDCQEVVDDADEPACMDAQADFC